MCRCPKEQDPALRNLQTRGGCGQVNRQLQGAAMGSSPEEQPLSEWEYVSLVISVWEPGLMHKAAASFNHMLWIPNTSLWNIYSLLDLLIILPLTFFLDFMTCLQGILNLWFHLILNVGWEGLGQLSPFYIGGNWGPEREGFWARVTHVVSGGPGLENSLPVLGSGLTDIQLQGNILTSRSRSFDRLNYLSCQTCKCVIEISE